MRTDITDLVKIAQALKQDSGGWMRNRLRPHFKQAITEFTERVHQTMPNKSGKMAQATRAWFYAELSASVGVDLSKALYAKYVIDGTRECGPFGPTTRKSLRWLGSGGFVFRRSFMHRATKANPFLQRAWDGYQETFNKSMVDAFNQEFEGQTK